MVCAAGSSVCSVWGFVGCGASRSSPSLPIWYSDSRRYTYQWFRVDSDGTSNKSSLTGETASAYTLVAADVGKKVIVEVSFTDDESNSEGPLASDPYPSGTGTVESSDGTPPTAVSATVDGTTLVITFNESLAAAANLANGAFAVKRTPEGETTEQTVTLTGTPSISGMTVTLTLDEAVIAGDTVTVTVTRAPCDALWCATLTAQDLGGGDRGCDNASSGSRCSSTDHLTGDSFRLDGTDHAVTELRDLASVEFRLGISPGLAADAPSLVLEVGGDEFRLPEADVQSADSLSWNLPRLDWRPGERV